MSDFPGVSPIRVPAENSKPERKVGRPFQKGKSGNPGGRPKSYAAIEREVWERFSPRLASVLAAVARKAEKGDIVAAKLFCERVVGPVRDIGANLAALTKPDLLARLCDQMGITPEQLDAMRAANGHAPLEAVTSGEVPALEPVEPETP